MMALAEAKRRGTTGTRLDGIITSINIHVGFEEEKNDGLGLNCLYL
tara:strand:- start:75 stop:212 length:138 start_codon:yes stop_codon:yes gene_type:complete